jgi:hypothetical protein
VQAVAVAVAAWAAEFASALRAVCGRRWCVLRGKFEFIEPSRAAQYVATSPLLLPLLALSGDSELGVALCSGIVWHYSQRGCVDDGAGWACGYRNLQMLVSAPHVSSRPSTSHTLHITHHIPYTTHHIQCSERSCSRPTMRSPLPRAADTFFSRGSVHISNE